MTFLGAIFVVAYAIGLFTKGRIGVLSVSAAAIPFNDSAAVVIGGIPITPFYLGMLIYLPLAYLRIGFPRPDFVLPWLLGLWGVVVTLTGPTVFAGMPVVASGKGLDNQIGRWSELDYTTSNAAQMIYLFLNLALLMALASSQDTKHWIPSIPAVVGTWVAAVMWLFREAGVPWPSELFANSPRRTYASGARLAGQFTEPSHLGAFALVSAVLLTVTVLIKQPRRALRVLYLLTIGADILLIVESEALTALAGAGIFTILALSWGLYRVLLRNAKIPIFLPFFLAVMVVALPKVVEFTQGVIEYKFQARRSIAGRSSADATSLQVFLDSGGFGVGLGSNRSSSMLLLLLSTVGIVGTLIFFLLMGRAISDGLRDRSRLPFVAALIAILSASLASLPDLVSPMTWLLVGFCWNSGQRGFNDEMIAHEGNRPKRPTNLDKAR